jgi:hypothetical protein
MVVGGRRGFNRPRVAAVEGHPGGVWGGAEKPQTTHRSLACPRQLLRMCVVLGKTVVSCQL